MRITSFKITNFRSLKQVAVGGLAQRVIFHGPNNTGKSNLLQALQTIFSGKVIRSDDMGLPMDLAQDISSRATPTPLTRTPFWYGKLLAFQDNFYMRLGNTIKFEVRITLTEPELSGLEDAEALEITLGAGHDYKLRLNGRIEAEEEDAAIVLEQMTINHKDAFRRVGENEEYLPSSAASDEKREGLIRALLDYFTDSVYVIPSSRYIVEEELVAGAGTSLESGRFKNWLHQQSLSRSGFQTFDTVRCWFNDPPFSYGDISFMQEGTDLEIMVDNDGLRVPIGAKGSGVQQVLVLLAFVASQRPQVIAIEEPELNLSYANQDHVVNKLRDLVETATERPHQLLITSHSDHVGSRDDLKQFRVDYDASEGTTVRRFTDADRNQLFPRSPGRMRIPGL